MFPQLLTLYHVDVGTWKLPAVGLLLEQLTPERVDWSRYNFLSGLQVAYAPLSHCYMNWPFEPNLVQKPWLHPLLSRVDQMTFIHLIFCLYQICLIWQLLLKFGCLLIIIDDEIDWESPPAWVTYLTYSLREYYHLNLTFKNKTHFPWNCSERYTVPSQLWDLETDLGLFQIDQNDITFPYQFWDFESGPLFLRINQINTTFPC